MWTDLKECYSVVNGPRINQLKSEYHMLRQKGISIVSYYNKFKGLWEELYGSEDLTCGCVCEVAAKLRARVEREKTHDFVMGLDDEDYGALRTQILSIDPIPSINKAYFLGIQIESHMSIVHARYTKPDAMSFATLHFSSSPSSGGSGSS